MHLPPYSFLSHSLSQRTGERKHAQFHGRSDTEHARTCWKASLHFPFQELLIKLIAQKVSRSKCDSTTAMDPGNGWQEGLGGGGMQQMDFGINQIRVLAPSFPSCEPLDNVFHLSESLCLILI